MNWLGVEKRSQRNDVSCQKFVAKFKLRRKELMFQAITYAGVICDYIIGKKLGNIPLRNVPLFTFRCDGECERINRVALLCSKRGAFGPALGIFLRLGRIPDTDCQYSTA